MYSYWRMHLREIQQCQGGRERAENEHRGDSRNECRVSDSTVRVNTPNEVDYSSPSHVFDQEQHSYMDATLTNLITYV